MRNGAISTVRWILSMLILCIGEFMAYTGTEFLSRQLQAPELPRSSFLEFPLRVRSHRISTWSNWPNEYPLGSATFKELKNPMENNSPDSFYDTINASNRGISSEFLDQLSESFEKNYLSLKTIERAIHHFKTDPFLVNQLDYQNRPIYEINQRHFHDEYAGPALDLVFAWPTLDYEFNSIEERDEAIFQADYIAENNLPLGLEVWRDKVFISVPKWKEGVPATLSTVSKFSDSKSPKLKPYPNWQWHRADNCQGLLSVFRMQVDECDRLWVLDSGKTNIATEPTQTCPPTIFIFDLKSDLLIRKYTFPDDHVKQDSLFINIAVDVRDEDCGSAAAYIVDVWRFGLVVYDFYKDQSYRLEHHYFYPDPLAARYNVHGIKFQWIDGLFGIALSPIDVNHDRTLFFHPMTSFREFAVTTSILIDKKTANENTDKFTPIGRQRAKDYGHSSGSAIDKHGVMFFNMATRDSVWCWDTRKEYIPQNLGVVGTSNVSLVFPNDIRVDHEEDQSIWIISNRLPMYLYRGLDPTAINFRIFKAKVREAVKNTVCDPSYTVTIPSDPGYVDEC